MQRHVRRFSAGFPRSDLRRLGCHLRSLLIRTIRHAPVFDPDRFFDSFSSMLAAVLSHSGHIYWEWPANCIGWSSVELREFRAQQTSCGRELFITACGSCFFAKKENNLLERHRWQFLTSDPRFEEYMSLEIPNTRGNEHQKERENIHLQ